MSAIPEIELRHLRYFAAVAGELHFGKAAARLRIAGPSLSRQIRQLESSLGYPLFIRGTRQVTLTEAGAVFYAQVRELLCKVTFATTLGASSVARDKVTRVGYSPWLIHSSSLIEVRNKFVQGVGSEVSFYSECTASQIEDLVSGRLAAGIIVLPIKPTIGLTIYPIRKEPLLVALPETHALAQGDALALAALSGSAFVTVSRSIEPAALEYLERVSRDKGFVPNVQHQVTSPTEALEFVATGAGVALVGRSAASNVAKPGVRFCACSDPELEVELGLAYPASRVPTGIEWLIDSLRQMHR